MALLSTTDFPLLIEKNDGFSHGRIDLHCHTHCSDGTLSPQTLIDRAVNYQIDVLAITDHDTVEGFDIALDYIVEKNIPIKLVSGIEISTAWQGFEIHIVGLNIDINNLALQQLISCQQEAREQRAVSIGEKLAKCGFEDAYHDAKKLAGSGTITRAHFAKVLYQQGHVGTMQKAFDEYLGKKSFINNVWLVFIVGMFNFGVFFKIACNRFAMILHTASSSFFRHFQFPFVD